MVSPEASDGASQDAPPCKVRKDWLKVTVARAAGRLPHRRRAASTASTVRASGWRKRVDVARSGNRSVASVY
jgi:hypothetical protein